MYVRWSIDASALLFHEYMTRRVICMLPLTQFILSDFTTRTFVPLEHYRAGTRPVGRMKWLSYIHPFMHLYKVLGGCSCVRVAEKISVGDVRQIYQRTKLDETVQVFDYEPNLYSHVPDQEQVSSLRLLNHAN